MSSVEYFQEFVNERLTAAAEEIFKAFKRTVVEYEEEIDRQRRLLDICWKPEIKLYRIELPQQHVCKEEEVLTEQQLCNQESLDQEDTEPPQIKEEQEELCASQEGEQLVLKQEETDTFMFTYGESESQFFYHSSYAAENQDQTGDKDGDSGSTRGVEPKNHHRKGRSHSDNTYNSNLSEIYHSSHKDQKSFKCDTSGNDFDFKSELQRHQAVHTELTQQHVCKEEEVLTEQQLCKQERSSSLDQEDTEPPQIKEEQEEPCISQEGEQLVLKQEDDDTFMSTPTHEESDHSEPGPNSDLQLLSNNSHVAESQDEKVDKLGDSEPTRNTEPKTKEKCNQRSHSHNLSKPDSSEMNCNTHTGQTSLKCEICGKDFKYKSRLRAHLKVHTDEKPYSCNTCGKKLKNALVLNSHKRTHTGEKPYSCDTCGKRFTQSSYLKAHVKIHTGEEAHLCKTCGKRFITLSILKAHIRTHTGERPYLCKTCGERFKQASALVSHTRIHTGEKPFTCKTCGKSFRQRWDLIVHMRIHTGEKPYSCDTCGKRFIQISLLNRHKLIHTGVKP